MHRPLPLSRLLSTALFLGLFAGAGACFPVTDDSGGGSDAGTGSDAGGLIDGGGATDGGGGHDGGGGPMDGGGRDGGGGPMDGGGAMDGGRLDGGGTTDGGAGGACENAGDRSSLASGAVEQIAGTCGPACMTETDQVGCLTPCIMEESLARDAPLSEGCATCLAENTACTLQNCLATCAFEPTGADCAACRCEMCEAVFQACAGLSSGACAP